MRAPRLLYPEGGPEVETLRMGVRQGMRHLSRRARAHDSHDLGDCWAHDAHESGSISVFTLFFLRPL